MTATIQKCFWYLCITVFSITVIQAQEINATMADYAVGGIVRSSETGLPIPGVSVTIAGVASSITDDEGRFNLRVTVDDAIILFRCYGYANKEVVPGKKTELVVEMHDESFPTVYKPVVSTFGHTDWRKTTGAMTSVSGGEQYKKAIVTGESMIQDEGLGVNTIMRSGAPGAGANMFIRGFTSINATNQPLILIDGVPFENSATAPSLVSGNIITPLTGIDAKDIENITIMRDATSIFGSKGANGAILIETAKATDKATKINFHAYAGINPVPTTLYPMMNSWQYRSYLSEMLATNGNYTPAQIQALPYINQDKPIVQNWGIENNSDYFRYNHDTDWQKEVFKSSVTQNYYLSIKGGDDIALYALSVGMLTKEGGIDNTNFNRYTTQFNTIINTASWMKIKSNMNFSYGDRQLSFESISPNFNPMYVSLIKAPFMSSYLYQVTKIDDETVGERTPNFEQTDVFGISNPTALVDKQTAISDISYRFFGNVGVFADLGKYFDLGLTFGVIFDKMRENIFLPKNGLNHDALPAGKITNASMSLVSRYLQYYMDSRVGFHREFDNKHDVSAKLGFRYQTNMSKANWIEGHNSSSDDLKSVGNGILDLSSTSGIIGDWKWLSIYLNGEYGYRNRYFVSLNMAMDGSSRFGKKADGMKIGDNVFGLFPSITGAWLISSEDFMMDLMSSMKINLLKLRLGYSISGNDDIGNYSARTFYLSQTFLSSQGLVQGNFGNPELKWETNTKLNAGLDIVMLNERLRLSFDLYQSVTSDLLAWRQSENIFYGIDRYIVNDGTMRNRGFEIGVYGRIVNRAVKWDMGIHVSHYKNEVTDMSLNKYITELAGGNVLTEVGKPLGLFYGYKTNGVYANSAEAAAEGLHILRGDGTPIYFQAGDVRYVNTTGNDKVINEDDMTVIGDPNPDFFGSITNRLQWKRLTLNVVFTYAYGNDIYNALRASVESMTGPENQTQRILNRWSYEGHNTSVPRAVWNDPMGNARFSDRWIEDGSYLRLKTMSLSYDIPIKQGIIKGVQVYITGNNLLTFTKYLGYDPEFSSSQSPLAFGIDTGITPMPRSVFFGVKVGL